MRKNIIIVLGLLLGFLGISFFYSDYYKEYGLAKKYCNTLEESGVLSASCSVNPFNKKISFGINAESGELDGLCGLWKENIKAIIDTNISAISLKNWSIEISTPYSNGSSVIFCKL